MNPMQTKEPMMTMMITPVAVMNEIRTGGDTHDSVLREKKQCSRMDFQVQYLEKLRVAQEEPLKNMNQILIF